MSTWRERLILATKRLGRDERTKLAQVLAPLPRSARVLEIGCGFGRKLALLRTLGFASLKGVEMNPAVAAAARVEGFEVLTPEAFAAQAEPGSFDLLVLAHVIEHMDHKALLAFLDQALDNLTPNGRLLVLSPVLHRHFWLDLDHVKPYYPQGFKTFFGKGDDQVQRYSRHRLKLVDLRFRRSPFKIKLSRALILKRGDLPVLAWNWLLALAFRASFGLVGHVTGWIGLYEKR